MGVALGARASTDHCPQASALTGDKGECYTHFPTWLSASATAAAAAVAASTALAAAAASSSSAASALFATMLNPVCADCSGYDGANISQIHLYVEEPCRSVFGTRYVECMGGRTASDVVPGLGMIPSGDAARPTQITFNLTTMRRKDMVFTRFRARPGIVRRLYHDVEDGGCGACTDDSPMCGAQFTVMRDGQTVYSAAGAYTRSR